jgi:hypothetical protein
VKERSSSEKKEKMMKKFVVASLVLMLVVSSAQAAYQHIGSNDPTTEGFLSAGIEAPTGPDAGPPANWDLVNADTSGYYYRPWSWPPDAAWFAGGWTLRFIVRVDFAYEQSDCSTSVKDGVSWWNIVMPRRVDDGDLYPDTYKGFYWREDSPGDFTEIGDFDPGDGFHEVLMVLTTGVDPDDPADDIMTITVDGLFPQVIGRDEVYATTDAELSFGDSGYAGPGGPTNHHWALWRLTPEPATMIVLALGGGLALLRRRR